MRSKDIEAQKRSLKLNRKQRSIIVGTLLGDGHLETQNHGRTYRLKIEHSSKQAFYVDWLYEQLKDWVMTSPKSKQKLLKGVQHENYGFQTLSVGQLRFYGKNFYDSQARKCLPRQLGKWLTPLALAIWFMDDGSSKSKFHKAVILNTHCFTKRELRLVQDVLMKNFAIETTLRNQREGLQILIAGKSAESFIKLIQPYVLPDFYYKFGPLVNALPKE